MLDQVDGLGASLFLTDTRAIVVRFRAEHRPRTGVRAWSLSEAPEVRLVPPKNGIGRILLRTGPDRSQAVSLFVGAEEWPDAERVARELRLRVARSRRPSDSSGYPPESEPGSR